MKTTSTSRLNFFLASVLWGALGLGCCRAADPEASASTFTLRNKPIAPHAPPLQQVTKPMDKEVAKSVASQQIVLPPDLARTREEVARNQRLMEAYQLMEKDENDKAARIFSAVLKEFPTDRRARMGLATALYKTRQYVHSIKLHKEIIAEYPNEYCAKNNLSWLFATADDPAVQDSGEAIKFAQDALINAPNNNHVWSTLSEAYYIDGNYHKSLRAATEALNLGIRYKLDAAQLDEYREQIYRARKADQALSILE